MNESGICPLLAMASTIRSRDPHCLEDRCAWWTQDNCGYCVFHRIGGDLEAIQEGLECIGHLMAEDE